MTYPPIYTAILLFTLSTGILSGTAQGQTQGEPAFFLSIHGTLGRHTIQFKEHGKSSGYSFGFSVSAGIYAIYRHDYRGGLVFTLLEAASLDQSRRQMSETFDLPHPKYDKHLIFNFAQFRSASIGWHSEVGHITASTMFYHQIGFGIFGTTEKDQLLDFGISNQAGLLIGQTPSFRGRLGITSDHSFGTGNPNYRQSNWGLVFGGTR